MAESTEVAYSPPAAPVLGTVILLNVSVARGTEPAVRVLEVGFEKACLPLGLLVPLIDVDCIDAIML